MRNSQLLTRLFAMAVVALWVSVVLSSRAATAAEDDQSKTVDGLALYLGVVPAEIVKGPSPHSAERPMHGRVPRGPHEYHVVVAIFDAASGARISDATVTVQISGLGLAGTKKKLDPMDIANTVTYGAFFDLPGLDLYIVRLTVERPGGDRPATVDFKYDHRRK
jgi:hypothetical protein